MPKQRIARQLRRLVRERAQGCCEYYLSQEAYATQGFSVEHITPQERGGGSAADNLALACQGCNNFKYNKTSAFDPGSRQMVLLFHPRQQQWHEHFAWNHDCTLIIGLTPTGRAAVEELHLNRLAACRRELFDCRLRRIYTGHMSRKFKTADYEATLNSTVTLRECLPPDHLARFIVDVITQLDLSAIYAHYGPRGGEAIAPEILLGLLFYGYATGTFSARKIERATYESMPYHFLAGGLHPDHDTIANFRKTFLPELKDLFVYILLYAQELGVLTLGNISLDGTKIHADASKSSAISYRRLLELDSQLRTEVDKLFALTEHAEQTEMPEGLVIADAIAFRQERLVNLAKAKAVLEARAQDRYAAEQAAYDAKVREREATSRQTGSNPRGRPPTPPTPGPRDKDQYNFTDPESRIMKNSNNDGFDQHYNVQAAVEQDSFLIVASTLSNHPNDQAEAIPTLDAIPLALGKPQAGALDNGYCSATNIAAMEARDIEPYIATGRIPHHPSWQAYFAQQPVPPPADASPKVHMAYKLQTDIGGAIYRLRKCTVEPVLGIIKDILGFRQFSLRGLRAAAGEWCLVCIAFNLKRLHTLTMG